MIQIYSASSRFTSDHGWLKTSHSFSFADYYDPNNTRFGSMRVLNDDYVQPLKGFGEHPHREMEIVSIVLKGQLQHRDSAGNTEMIRRSDIQRMSAGIGVIHSEMNPSDTEEVNFLQLWFEPKERGRAPSYEQISYDENNMLNRLIPVVSQHARDNTAYIHQDMTIYLSRLDEGGGVSFSQPQGRKIFLFVIEGDLIVQHQHQLGERDSARITDTADLHVESSNGAFFMLIDLA